MPDIKVHLYQVFAGVNSPDLSHALRDVQQAPLADRLRLIGQQELRVEAISSPRTDGNQTPYWLIDFTRLRFDHGPGRASRALPIEGFQLNQDQGFGEETAALYDPVKGYLLVQYNHFGVRPGSMQAYLSSFNANHARAYEFRVKLDETSEVRLAQKQILKKITFKVAPAKMTAAQRTAGVSLTRALDLSDAVSGETIEVTISSGRGAQGLNFNRIRTIISDLQALAFQGAMGDTAIVEKFEVAGKETPIDRLEAIDMLTPKVEQVVDGVLLGNDLRYTRESRWRALIRARNGWATLIDP